jgi:hypothetical protein
MKYSQQLKYGHAPGKKRSRMHADPIRTQVSTSMRDGDMPCAVAGGFASPKLSDDQRQRSSRLDEDGRLFET